MKTIALFPLLSEKIASEGLHKSSLIFPRLFSPLACIAIFKPSERRSCTKFSQFLAWFGLNIRINLYYYYLVVKVHRFFSSVTNCVQNLYRSLTTNLKVDKLDDKIKDTRIDSLQNFNFWLWYPEWLICSV